jgi:hypothetical protein
MDGIRAEGRRLGGDHDGAASGPVGMAIEGGCQPGQGQGSQ